jgi:hypothetical protein
MMHMENMVLSPAVTATRRVIFIKPYLQGVGAGLYSMKIDGRHLREIKQVAGVNTENESGLVR